MTSEPLHSESIEPQIPKKTHSKFHLILGLLLTVFLFLVGVDAYYHYQGLKIQTILNDLQVTEEQKNTDLEHVKSILVQQAKQLEEQEKNWKQWMGSASEIKAHNEKIYAASEIKHWIRMAVFNWSVHHDVESTIQLLQTMQVRLNLLKDSAFEPLKQSLSENLSALEVVRTVSVQELQAQWLTLDTQLDSLPSLVHSTAIEVEKIHPESKSMEAHKKSPEKRDWTGLWQSMQSMWKQWVVISKDEEIALPLLSSSQRYLLNWYLHMLLTLAQTEAMNYQWRVCAIHLQQSIHQIQQFYSMDSKEVQSLVKQLTVLRDKSREAAQLPVPNLNKLLDEINRLEIRSLL